MAIIIFLFHSLLCHSVLSVAYSLRSLRLCGLNKALPRSLKFNLWRR
jgi:hypothetical protein